MALTIVWTAEKVVDEKEEGEYITRKIHRVMVDKETTAIGMLFVERLNFGDDCECDYNKGMFCDQDGDLRWIEVDKFIEAIEEYISAMEKENKDEGEEWDIIAFKTDLEKIKKYKGYTIWSDFERIE
jgi:hypothetical protein